MAPFPKITALLLTVPIVNTLQYCYFLLSFFKISTACGGTDSTFLPNLEYLYSQLKTITTSRSLSLVVIVCIM